MLTIFILLVALSCAITWGVVGANDLDKYLADGVAHVPPRVRIMAACMFPAVLIVVLTMALDDERGLAKETLGVFFSAVFKGHTMVEPDDDFN